MRAGPAGARCRTAGGAAVGECKGQCGRQRQKRCERLSRAWKLGSVGTRSASRSCCAAGRFASCQLLGTSWGACRRAFPRARGPASLLTSCAHPATCLQTGPRSINISTQISHNLGPAAPPPAAVPRGEGQARLASRRAARRGLLPALARPRRGGGGPRPPAPALCCPAGR